jgi:hypothetical protein
MEKSLVVFALAAAVSFGGFSVVACGSNDPNSGVANPKLPKGSDSLAHEDCSESGNRVEMLDTNNDGKPDIRRVFDKGSGHELCRVVDLNHDGKPDLFEYFDGSGTIRRREFCYDDTGVVNAIEYYEGGKLARREYDTTGQHKIDTWDWFDPPITPDMKSKAHPTRRQRDTTGDGKIDQWWTWNGDVVTIAIDKTGDGKPDPDATITIGGADDGGAAATTPGSAEGGSPSSGGASGEGGAPAATVGDAAATTSGEGGS